MSSLSNLYNNVSNGRTLMMNLAPQGLWFEFPIDMKSIFLVHKVDSDVWINPKINQICEII